MEDGALLDSIYSGIFDSTAWTPVLAGLIERSGGQGGALQAPPVPGVTDHHDVYLVHNVDPSTVDLGVELLRISDPVSEGLANGFERTNMNSVTMYRSCDLDRVYRTPWWNEFWITQMCGDMAVMVIDLPEDGPLVTLNVFKGRQGDTFGDDDLARLNALTPHLRFAMRTRRKLSTPLSQRDTALLDASPIGCVVLGAKGEVLHANRCATQHIGQGFDIVRGILKASCLHSDHALQTAIADAVLRRRDGRPRRGSEIRLQAGPRTLTAVVVPIGNDNPFFGEMRAARATLFLLDDQPAPLQSRAADRLRQVFALTTSQASIALALMEGATPAEIADSRQVSCKTVQNQIAALLSKTGMRRIYELQAMRPLAEDG